MCTVQGNLKDVEISRSITSALLLVLYKDGIPGESSLLTDNLNLTARLSNVRIIQGGPKVTSQRFELIARPLIT